MTFPAYKPGPQPCICREYRGADCAAWCSYCGCRTNECIPCMPEPECECLWIAEDMTDARGCELHDPRSEYNRMVAAHARPARKAAHSAIEQFFSDRRAS